MLRRLLGRTTHSPSPKDFAHHADEFGDVTWAAIDVETTGLSPKYHRLVEVAVVKFNLKDGVLEEFSTTINPGRDISVEVTGIHGLAAKDLAASPTFDQVAGHIINVARGSVLIAHNMRFDWDFLEYEFRRQGYFLEPLPTLCTLSLSDAWNPSNARRLTAAAESLGIIVPHSHRALDDARVCRQLFTHLATHSIPSSHRSLRSLGCNVDVSAWHRLAPLLANGTPMPREEAKLAVERQVAYLSTLVSRLPDAHSISHVGAAAAAAYLDLLGRALEDSFISAAEAESLAEIANAWKLTRADVEVLHRDYFAALVQVAWMDGRISAAEEQEILAVGAFLGLTQAEQLHALKSPPLSPSARVVTVPPEDLHGKSVCFTGDLTCTMRGEPITRDDAHAIALSRGLFIRESVTKSLDILVVADPTTQSGKAKKARSYGIRIWSEEAFWRALSVGVD